MVEMHHQRPMGLHTPRYRWLPTRLPKPDERRLVVLTGARQTGKTTLARFAYPTLRYSNLDSLEIRDQLRSVRADRWAQTVGPSVLDEAQKEPSVFEKVKFAYDDGALDFSVLLGSSRILLLERVKETLAGRAFLYELWPLMASEVRHSVDETPQAPLLDRLLGARASIAPVLEREPSVLLGEADARRKDAIEHLLRWGGMPELLRLDDDQRREWLRSYQQTYLERDLADLTRLADLEPFRALQSLCALRSGRLVSYAELGRDAGISAQTARRYLVYLNLSYQVVLLQPFRRNLTSAVVKSPKLHWIDLGLARHITRQWGEPSGEQFESFVVSEVHKWCSTMARDVGLSFYRTRSGLEVDLLIQTEHGVLGIEIKNRAKVDGADTRALRAVATELGAEWLGGLVVHRGEQLDVLHEQPAIWALPVHRLL